MACPLQAARWCLGRLRERLVFDLIAPVGVPLSREPGLRHGRPCFACPESSTEATGSFAFHPTVHPDQSSTVARRRRTIPACQRCARAKKQRAQSA